MTDPLSDLTPLIDGDGNERRLGLWLPPEDAVSAGPVYETSAFPILTDAEIKRLITDPNRTPSNQMFDDHWVVEGDQKSHGSCNGWAGAMVLSKTRWMRGIQDGLVLSGSYVYSWINNGQDNGSALDRGMAELAAHGAPPASMCGWNNIYRDGTKQFDTEAMKHMGLASFELTTKQGLDSALALRFMVVVAVHVGNAFMNYKGSGNMPLSNGMGNHAIHCDDLKLVNGALTYCPVNNWNLSWGSKGRGLCSFDSFKQTMRQVDTNGRVFGGPHRFYAITSTQEAA